ncbi:Signal transduction histidine-protein kinase BarA [Thiorhodovibrio winogradskyi]|uniref:histidine kinase n=1 Tax=Thiorhodovibrio winogradskyi TaxID=77007 RepID=A0ABZ0S9K7_9GAMM|nr:PAS domain S-box protein [Thiorhodovibrio winogradskyi]
MQSAPWHARLRFALLGLLALVLFPALAPADVPPRLRVVTADNYPPFLFRTVDGQLTGYLVDYWRLWENKTGVAVELSGISWLAAQQAVLAGAADAIDMIFKTPARDELYDFAPPYAELPVNIYSHNSIAGIADVNALKGFRIGVQAGDACAEELTRQGINDQVHYPDYTELLAAAERKEIRIFCLDQYPAAFYLYRLGLQDDFHQSFTLYTGALRRAVPKGNLETLQLIERGMAAISDAEQQALKAQWFGEMPRPDDPINMRSLVLVIVVLLALGLGGLVWSAQLRRQVRARTADLQQANATLEAQGTALGESERHLRILLQTIPDPVWLKDAEGHYRFCNRRVEDLFGAPATEIIGKTDDALVEQHLADAFRTHDQAAMDSGQAKVNEDQVVFACDGRAALLQTIKTPVHDEQGQVIGVLGIARDITQLKQIEQELAEHRSHLQELVEERTRALTEERQRLANILEGTRAGTWEWNVQTGQTRFNERWAEIIGYRLEELAPVDFNTWTHFAHPEDWQHAKTLLEHHFAGKLDYYECEARMLHRDGHWIWVLVRGKLVCRDAEGQPLWMAGTHIDITPLKQVQQAVLEAKEQAEQATQDKSRFLANMSHEIRTPMNAILGLAYLLERQDLPKDARDLAGKIHRSGQSLLGIINDILDLSKIESGKIEIERIPFQLTRVLDNLATIMTTTAKSKALELVIVPPACSDWPLLGDPLRLGQVLINLTSNAIKFTEKGLVEVRIEPVETNGTQVRLRFAVKDTGIGISTEARNRLFEPFIQADASTTRHFGGSGLGLAISRRLVELMGGRIQLSSQVGAGSTFWFELSFRRLPSSALQGRVSVPMHVLVVEHDPCVRDGLLATITALGWTVTATETAEAALQRVLHDTALQGPDAVVLLDWQMPGCDLLATAHAIHGTLPPERWPLLMVLSSESLTPLQGSLNAGMVDAVLGKPLTPSPLYDAVGRARGRRLGEPITPLGPMHQSLRLVGVRLLVVDDSEINREVAQRIFTNEGALVSLANDGQQALDWLTDQADQADQVDVVLMDVQMPVMDGYEATRRIRQHEALAQLPVIALTAGAMREQEIAAEQAGMNAFLSKPFDVEAAVALILRLTPRNSPQAVSDLVAAPPPTAGCTDEDLPGLAVTQALNIWKDPEVYRRYLRKFAAEYIDVVTHMRAADPEEARRLAHKLKGAAGNLGLDAVAAGAARVDAVGATPETTEPLVSATTDLQAALDTALASIAVYTAEPVAVAPEPAQDAPQQPDIDVIAPLFRSVHAALSNFDPDGAGPSLSQLAGHLRAEQLSDLQRAIDNLDATTGEAAVRALAAQFGIQLAEEP